MGVKELTYLEKVEKDYLRIEAENKRYKKTLRFYADGENHDQEFCSFEDTGFKKSKVMEDGGELARKALIDS